MTGMVIDDEPSILHRLAVVLKLKSSLRLESIGIKGAESVFSDPFLRVFPILKKGFFNLAKGVWR